MIGIMPRRALDLLEAIGLPGPAGSDAELAQMVERGLPVVAVDRLLGLGFQKQELFRLVIPQRTLTHRRQRGHVLTGDESDKIVRLARARFLALRVFGDERRAWQWLRKGKRGFGGRAPIDLLATEAGARAVEEELHRIDEGMFV